MTEPRMEVRHGAAVFLTPTVYRDGSVGSDHEVYAVSRLHADRVICGVYRADGTGESANVAAVTVCPMEYEPPSICLPCLRAMVAQAESLVEQGVI
jgi:hypothetical protein